MVKEKVVIRTGIAEMTLPPDREKQSFDDVYALLDAVLADTAYLHTIAATVTHSRPRTSAAAIIGKCAQVKMSDLFLPAAVGVRRSYEVLKRRYLPASGRAIIVATYVDDQGMLMQVDRLNLLASVCMTDEQGEFGDTYAFGPELYKDLSNSRCLPEESTGNITRSAQRAILLILPLEGGDIVPCTCMPQMMLGNLMIGNSDVGPRVDNIVDAVTSLLPKQDGYDIIRAVVIVAIQRYAAKHNLRGFTVGVQEYCSRIFAQLKLGIASGSDLESCIRGASFVMSIVA